MAPAVLVIAASLLARSALAYSAGLDTSQCGDCHGGGQTPTVAVKFTPDKPSINETVEVEVTITVPAGATNNKVAGVSVSASVTTDASERGRFVITDLENTRVGDTSNAFIHAMPKAAASGVTKFTANWVVPSDEGAAVFTVAAVAADDNKNRTNDGARTITSTVLFGCEGIPFYADFDSDGYGGRNATAQLLCGLKPGYSATKDDCDDNDERVHPGATELCNGRDDNCNNQIDDGLQNATLYPDSDHDGYGVPGPTVTGCNGLGHGTGTDDCDDDDPTIFPSAREVCDLIDNDCDGEIDEGVHPICGIGRCARQASGCSQSSCTPGRPSPETCNGLDDDCDGTSDEEATCPGGGRCEESVCVGGSTNTDGGGGSDQNDSDEEASGVSSCGSMPFGVFAVLGAILALRRRYSLKRR